MMADRRADKNAAAREKYRQAWHTFNLRSRSRGEFTTPFNVSALPRLKRRRRSGNRSSWSANQQINPNSSVGNDSDGTSAGTSTIMEEGILHASTKAKDGPGPTPTVEVEMSEEDNFRYACGGTEVLETREIYRHLLLEASSISPCDEHYTKFVLEDFDHKNHAIKRGSYVMISRRSMCFSGNWKWGYFCSCDPSRSQVLRSASVYVQQRSEDMLPVCLHIESLASVLLDFDEKVGIDAYHPTQDHNYVSQLEEDLEIPSHLDDIWPVFGNPGAAIITSDQSFAVIDISGKGLKCRSCNRVECRHTDKIKKTIEQMTDLPVFLTGLSSLISSNEQTKSRVGSVTSWKSIPFHLEPQLQGIIAKPVDQRVCSVDGFLVLTPAQEGLCQRCSSSWSDERFLKGRYPVFALNNIHQATGIQTPSLR